MGVPSLGVYTNYNHIHNTLGENELRFSSSIRENISLTVSNTTTVITNHQ